MLFPRLLRTQFSISFLVFALTINGKAYGFIYKEIGIKPTHFLQPERYIHDNLPTFGSLQKHDSNTHHLFMKNDGADDFNEEINPDDLGDWRTFRMKLTEAGLPTTSTNTLPTESKSQPVHKPKSVSKRNEQVLKNQNEKLAEEYLKGVWAHSTPGPEVGGLVCRLPLEAELYRVKDRNVIGKKLKDHLQSNTNIDDSNEFSQKSSKPKQTSKSLPFSPLAAKTVHWYRSAQRLVKNELKKVTDCVKNGKIDSRQLSTESVEFLNLYLENQETWQEVNLLISRDKDTNTATTVTINRPMSSKLSESLGQLLLFGSSAVTSPTGELSLSQTELLVRFLIAFDSKCYVYIGGSHGRDEPAEIIHGIPELEGSRELAPGVGIYKGGIEAAVNGVMKGTYKPEEFRFFVGKDIYENGELERKVFWGKYQPVACARSLALKQCISLPKPLWHEVMELCGGELKELSSLDLMERNDIVSDESDSMDNIDMNDSYDNDYDWGKEDSV